MVKLIFIVLAIVVAFAIRQHWKKSTPENRKKFGMQIALYGFLGLLGFMVVTGRLHILIAAGAAILPYLRRLLPLLKHTPVIKQLWKSRQMFAGGAAATSLIEMKRDQESGRFIGKVISGDLSGRTFDDLSEQELRNLYQEARTRSADSILLLQAYLEQRYGAQWRLVLGGQRQQQSSSASSSGMSISEAYQVLGVEESASLKEVLTAHKKLIQKVHPDRGGSDFLAAQINQAKDVLSKHLS